jgi:HEPN domain-containing protein
VSKRYHWEVWLEQAEHDAEVAGVLAERGYWSDAIFHAVAAIEKTLKAVEAKPWTYGEMRITHHELAWRPRGKRQPERRTHGDLQYGRKPTFTHDIEDHVGHGHKKFWPDALIQELRSLKLGDLYERVRYPADDDPQGPPFNLYGEPQFREVERAMRAILEHARAELPQPPPG